MPQPHVLESSDLDVLASTAGVRVFTKRVIRFPALYLSELMRTVERNGLSGRICIDYDAQGKPGSVTWESAK